MSGDLMVAWDWLAGIRAGGLRIRRRRATGRGEVLEPRLLLAEDFGDAPDTGAGTGTGNFETLLANGGPHHTIVAGLSLGPTVDGEANATANSRANGDDISSSPDDEDGVVNPLADLVLTTGTQPTVTLRATNTTGTAATLSGWIDTNNNGVFETGERAQLSVPTGTSNGLVTLTFPMVPTGFTGTTYARFRLSTDAAAQNPTGAASNGEVEDYAVTIAERGNGVVNSGGITKIAGATNGGPTLANNDFFGRAVANLGDVDGDGVADIAVSASLDDTGGGNCGAVYVQFLNANGTVKSSTKIASGTNGGPTLLNNDFFGRALASLGDFDGDGVADLIVGAQGDDTGGLARGAVYIVRLNTDGTVKSSTKIASGTNGGPALANGDNFGIAVASVGDLDGDGIVDVTVGAYVDGTGGTRRGAVYVLRLNADGTVKASTKIASATNGGPTLADGDLFGASVANLGDMDGDGATDIAVGAIGDDTGGDSRGAVHVLRLNTDGSVKSNTKIAHATNGGPALADSDFFGDSVASVGDLDGDGVTDLAVGAYLDDTGGRDRGAVHVLRLKADGTVKSSTKIANGTNGGPGLLNDDCLGSAIASLGDFDGDGIADLLVGAYRDDSVGSNRGAVYILRLSPNHAPTALNLSSNTIVENSASGTTIGTLTTTDPDPVDTFTYTLVAGTGSTDNGLFTIAGNMLQTNGVFDFEAKSSYAIRIRTTDQGGMFFEQSLPISVTNVNDAPTLDNSGTPFAILGVGSRQSTEMRQGTLVSEILARGANGNPITDTDAGALQGIAITAVDGTLGTLQYTLVTANPQESDWKNVVTAGAVSNTSALLLPTTARLRFTTGLLPHHAAGAPFLPLESKLDAGFTFRAWDQTSGTVEGRADTTANGGGSAFSTATETAKIYFEARLFRIFNTVAGLNVYALEAEFNALTANPALVDRSTSGFTGFTILMSAVPELGTVPLFRLYFGVQFNDDGTQTDMGYRYLTSSEGEASILEGLGRADLRPTRQGAYFREIGDPRIPGDTGVNNGTAVLGYIYATQQPGTAQMTQVYRTDTVGKPTRPAGTVEGSTPTSTRPQEQGDHVYTTNIAFETSRPGTWRVEAARGFVRELTPSPTGVGPVPPSLPALVAADTPSGESRLISPLASDTPVVIGASGVESVSRLIAVRSPVGGGSALVVGQTAESDEVPVVPWESDDDETDPVLTVDNFFAETELVGASGWGV